MIQEIKVGEDVLCLRRPNAPELIKLLGQVRHNIKEGMVDEDYIALIMQNIGPFVSLKRGDEVISGDAVLLEDDLIFDLVKFSGELMGRLAVVLKKKS